MGLHVRRDDMDERGDEVQLTPDQYARLDMPYYPASIPRGYIYECDQCGRQLCDQDRCIEAGREGTLHFCNSDCFSLWREPEVTA